MLTTITANLRRIKSLTALSIEDYTDASTGPYYSSIGSHIRHVLDIFNCLANGLDDGKVDLTHRTRGGCAETDPTESIIYLNQTIKKIIALDIHPISHPLTLIDDLGCGNVATPATLGAIIFQAHSHAIHHFAIIGYILHIRELTLPDSKFGYNPTTPLNSQPVINTS